MDRFLKRFLDVVQSIALDLDVLLPLLQVAGLVFGRLLMLTFIEGRRLDLLRRFGVVVGFFLEIGVHRLLDLLLQVVGACEPEHFVLVQHVLDAFLVDLLLEIRRTRDFKFAGDALHCAVALP